MRAVVEAEVVGSEEESGGEVAAVFKLGSEV